MKIQCNCLSQYAISGWNIYLIPSGWYSLKQIFFSITFPLLHTPDCMLLNKACNLKPHHKSQFLNHLSEYIRVYPDISVYIPFSTFLWSNFASGVGSTASPKKQREVHKQTQEHQHTLFNC
jgi:hypothetical protein